jgi:hypothetical protein
VIANEGEPGTPGELEDALGPQFPEAHVRERDALAQPPGTLADARV